MRIPEFLPGWTPPAPRLSPAEKPVLQVGPSGELRLQRPLLAHNWPTVMRAIERDHAVVVVEEDGRIHGAVVGDSGQAGEGAIPVGTGGHPRRNAALVEGREAQITRFGQVVARIVPEARIADFLAGWKRPRETKVPKPKPVPKAAPKAAPKAPKVALAVSTSILPAAERRRLILEAAERRTFQPSQASARKAPKRARPLSENDIPREDEMFEEAPISLDEILNE